MTKRKSGRRGRARPSTSGGGGSKKTTYSCSSSAARIGAFTLSEMRGFAIANPELPVIVVNGRDYSQGGKAFTLLHELCHILLRRKRDLERNAAKAAHVTVERLKAWESDKDEDAPTLGQLRDLAAKYHFPLAVFYLPEPPKDFLPLRDFRRLQ
jgi:IrrE N-terminal-like domain